MMRMYLALAGFVYLVSGGPVRADYKSTILADNPIGYYRLGETAGHFAADSSGNGLTGIYFGGVTKGVHGGIANDSNTAVAFDGLTGHVRVLSAVGDDFSVELWMRTTAPSLTGVQGYQGNGLAWSDEPYFNPGDWIVAYLNNAACFFTGNPDDTIIGITPLNDGVWHHIVATRVRGGAKQLYVDGVLEASGITNSNPLAANPIVAIGANIYDGRYFSGSIDEVAFYFTALTGEQILAHYNAGIGR
jgi:hypothetical protein